MRAVNCEQARLAFVITKENDILAQQPNRDRRPAGRQFFGEGRGRPVSAEHLSARSPRPHLRQQLILLSQQNIIS